jgi:hypothetical protein
LSVGGSGPCEESIIPARRAIPACAAALLTAALANGQQPAPADQFEERLEAILSLGTSGAGAAKARAALQALFDLQIAFAPLDERDRFTGPAQWVRLCRLAGSLPKPDEARVLAGLREHPEFAAALAFVWRPEAEKPRPIAALAGRLIAERPEQVARFPSLAAAVCVVFDRERSWEFGQAPDALDIFDYFAAHDERLVLSARTTPPELLVHVVDSLVPAEQLEWALERYGTRAEVGRRYEEVPYDRGHFPGGAPLKLASTRGTLADMTTCGGVCRHQAHFAAHTAKAQGIPAAVVLGVGSGVSHAWLGFLEVKGGSAAWNFDTGRFGEYADMTGSVPDPQTGRLVPDGRLALLARAVAQPAADRRYAASLVDASVRLGDAKAPFSPEPPAGATVAAREPGPALAAELLEAAVNACPAHVPAWDTLTGLAQAGELPPEQVRRWSEAVVTLCGHSYPDFAVETLVPLIGALKDPPEQDKLWEWAFGQFTGATAGHRVGGKPPARRADLAARIRFEQGSMWEAAGDASRAWDAYAGVIDGFANQGPFVVEAVRRAEALLAREGKPASDTLNLYARAWGKVVKPAPGTSPEFLVASNYVRLGARYADLLEREGRRSQAEQVRRALPIIPPRRRP